MANFKDKIIIAVGGSLLVPEQIDVNFIADLKKIVINLVNEDYQVILVPGGGKTARNYQKALQDLGQKNPEDLDWVGVKAIHLNADFLSRAFSDLDVSPIIYQPYELKDINSSLVIKAAFEPGQSSDMGAVRMAKISGASRIINFSNTSHVYSADPRIDTHAQKFEELSWQDYRNIIPAKWVPGMSAPFDPIASELAEDSGITVAVLGASIDNLHNYLNNQEFEGTIIS